MALVMTPIYTQTVGAGGAATVTFNNIPQTYTDLVVVVSSRSLFNGWANSYMRFDNGSTTNYSSTNLNVATSSIVENYRSSNTGQSLDAIGGTNTTANTFSNIQHYISNYSSSNFKSIVTDYASENNGSEVRTGMVASLYRSTSPITTMVFSVASGFAQHSTFSLYGIIRSGA